MSQQKQDETSTGNDNPEISRQENEVHMTDNSLNDNEENSFSIKTSDVEITYKNLENSLISAVQKLVQLNGYEFSIVQLEILGT